MPSRPETKEMCHFLVPATMPCLSSIIFIICLHSKIEEHGTYIVIEILNFKIRKYPLLNNEYKPVAYFLFYCTSNYRTRRH